MPNIERRTEWNWMQRCIERGSTRKDQDTRTGTERKVKREQNQFPHRIVKIINPLLSLLSTLLFCRYAGGCLILSTTCQKHLKAVIR